MYTIIFALIMLSGSATPIWFGIGVDLIVGLVTMIGIESVYLAEESGLI